MGVLTNAALVDDLDRVRELLAQGHNINERDECNATPFHLAVTHGKIELVGYLVAQGADLDAKDNDEYTLLSYSIVEAEFEIFEILLSRGADAGVKEIDGDTVLHMIVLCNNGPTWINCLFDSVDIDPRTLFSMKNNDGDTPLHYVTGVASAECLIEYGFDPSTSGLQSTWMCPTCLSIRNERGKTPCEMSAHGAKTYLASFKDLPLINLATMKLSPGLNEFQRFLARRIYYTVLRKLPPGPDVAFRIMAFFCPADAMK